MGYGSSSRAGATVLWITLHTAEGARSARALASFFNGNPNASSHAACDASETLYMVPRSRAAWTLGPGNPYSMNLEMCGFARWSRAQWLSTGVVDGCPNPRGMITQAARWAKVECDHFGIPYDRIGVPAVSGWRESVIHHDDYTRGSGWGSHWDVGPDFPWDVFFADLTGGASPSGYMPFPLEAGHYYGPIDGPERSHGGYYPRERPIVRMIQQEFQRRGFAPSYPSWADGIWEQPTTDACRAWQAAVGLPVTGTVDADDWAALFPPPRKDDDMGIRPFSLPNTNQEWRNEGWATATGSKSAVTKRLWLSVSSTYGDTDYILILEGDGHYHAPAASNADIGSWEQPATVASGHRVWFEIPDAVEAVSLHYRTEGNPTAPGGAWEVEPK